MKTIHSQEINKISTSTPDIAIKWKSLLWLSLDESYFNHQMKYIHGNREKHELLFCFCVRCLNLIWALPISQTNVFINISLNFFRFFFSRNSNLWILLVKIKGWLFESQYIFPHKCEENICVSAETKEKGSRKKSNHYWWEITFCFLQSS